MGIEGSGWWTRPKGAWLWVGAGEGGEVPACLLGQESVWYNVQTTGNWKRPATLDLVV